MDIFAKRKAQYLVIFAVVGLLTLGSSIITNFDFLRAFGSFPKALQWIVGNFIPNEESLARLPHILTKLWETVLVSIAATMVASVFAFFFALSASKTTGRVHWLRLVARGVASVFRNIPVVAWAMILLFSFRQSTFTGFLALFFETFGFLVRGFTETIDEASEKSVEALQATGATYGHMIVHAVVPSSMPQLLSWILYMIETNIRSATLVGILTGTGIGFLFDIYYKRMNYNAAFLTTLTIVIVVVGLETISNHIRRRIL